MFQVADELQKVYPEIRVIYPPVRSGPNLSNYIQQGLSLTDNYSQTCRLGTVVDPTDFSLYRASNIHVVDASVFPEISDGNAYYPTMVMAEIAVDRIGRVLSH